MQAYYTGIGSRETPPEVISVMEDAAFRLARIGFTLRSGKAKGADAAFQIGVQKFCETLGNAPSDLAEIYIPWEGFLGDEDLWDCWDFSLNHLDYLIPEQKEKRDGLVREMHPAADKLTRGPFALHSRNTHQVLGANVLEERPSSFCLYYAPEDKNGNPKGGTATAVKLAKSRGVRTLNLLHPENLETLEKFLTSLEERRGIKISGKDQ